MMKEKKNFSNDLSILVYSCKKNSDMWDIFLRLFRKYWEFCKYELVLVTDSLPDEYKKTNVLHFDREIIFDGQWSEMILNALEVVNKPYVMLWMDDYLLCDYVNNNKIDELIQIAQKYSAANLRLMESPIIPCEVFDGVKNIGCYKPGTAYSISTQVGIWDSKFLNKYIKLNWSAWDFERLGSLEIKDNKHPFLVTLDYAFPYEEAVRRGKWMDNGVRLCKRNGIKIDSNKRKIMTNCDLTKIYFKGAILEINPTLVMKVQNFFNKSKN